MHQWVPANLRLAEETSAARWVEERLRPWASDAVLVESYMPDAFEAYARVFHPPYRPGGERVRWSELAQERGIELTEETTFFEVSGVRVYDDGEPAEGALPREELLALADLLGDWTASPDRCWFCFWEGDGNFWSRSHAEIVRPEEQGRVDAAMRSARNQDEVWNRAPRVHAPQREYILFSGPLAVVQDLAAIDPRAPALNMWWPDDRAWLVSTEVDSITSYVGASRAAINAILADGELEAVEAHLDTRHDPRR
jgi:hypothetical protein